MLTTSAMILGWSWSVSLLQGTVNGCVQGPCSMWRHSLLSAFREVYRVLRIVLSARTHLLTPTHTYTYIQTYKHVGLHLHTPTLADTQLQTRARTHTDKHTPTDTHT